MALTLPRLTARPGSFGRRADPGDFGAAEGAARAQGGGVVAELGGTLEALAEADQSARVARAVGQASARMQELKDSLDADPSYERHGELWEKGSREILGEATKGAGLLPGRFSGEFDARMGQIGARYGAEVRDGARRKQVDFARASLTEAGQNLSSLAARTQDPDQRAAFHGEHQAALRDAVRSGLITFEDYQARARSFDRSISEADRLAALETDPAGVFNALRDPEHPLNLGLSAAESLEWRKRAREEFNRQRQDQRAEAKFLQDQADRAEKDADDAADEKALDLLAGGNLAGLQQHLQDTRGVLSRERRQFYLDRIASGGGISDQPGGPNPAAYIDLSNRAAAGVLSRDEIDAAAKANLITKADRDQLVKAAGDRRFEAAEQFLKDALPKKPMFGPGNPRRDLQNAEAQRAFTQWKLDNPKATDAEAMAYARELLKFAGQKALQALPPAAPAFDPIAATQAAMGLPPAERDAALARIEAMEQAQALAGAPK